MTKTSLALRGDHTTPFIPLPIEALGRGAIGAPHNAEGHKDGRWRGGEDLEGLGVCWVGGEGPLWLGQGVLWE